MPYCSVSTGYVLQWLYALCVQGVGLSTLARHSGVARGTLRYLKARFLRTLPKLRLPRREGVCSPAALFSTLTLVEPAAIADLFREWKEREPKHSIVGIYLRC